MPFFDDVSTYFGGETSSERRARREASRKAYAKAKHKASVRHAAKKGSSYYSRPKRRIGLDASGGFDFLGIPRPKSSGTATKKPVKKTRSKHRRRPRYGYYYGPPPRYRY